MCMSVVSAVCACLLAVAPVPPDNRPKQNTLTPKEIADGWLLLFDGQTTFGWTAKAAKEKAPTLTVKDGVLVVTGSAGGEIRFGTRFLEFEMTGEYRNATKKSSVTINMGGTVSLGHDLLPQKDDEWGKIKARFTFRDCLLTTGGPGSTGPFMSFKPVPPYTEVRFVLPMAEAARIELRNLKLRPLIQLPSFTSVAWTKPLFNGKDLTGWKVNTSDPKRMASKFEVTKAGELHATNGPGDLQTTTQYADFVLQLECKTNGKGLNSGVFFRCVPDQYQQGYEAQIQNAYLGNDRTKPVDFGTGAIYRRVPARKVVSNDNEWFTMTVVARGPHISTWVNGYQTVDWTDDRKPSDNPRQGLKTGKGHISIQGHDPTTDLLFRNIRIAELPAGK